MAVIQTLMRVSFKDAVVADEYRWIVILLVESGHK